MVERQSSEDRLDSTWQQLEGMQAMTFDLDTKRPVPIGRPTHLTGAATILEATDGPGFIRMWSNSLSDMIVVLERDDEGRWWRTSPYTGLRERVKRP